MIFDARSLETGAVLECDLCIIGSGAAGITLAMELRGSGLKICVLESGGQEFDAGTQALYAGSASFADYPDPETSRLRYFGGSTNHWSGSTQRFSVSDFEHRPWVPNSGWPITRRDLEPYYERAHFYAELPPPAYDVKPLLRGGKLKPLPLLGETFRYNVGYSSPPTRFAEAYGPALRAAADIHVYLNANVTEIVAAGDGLSVAELRCQVLDGPAFTARAGHYVLATGGIENARMLLVSRSVHANGLGNAEDVVGRYFMDHPVVGFGIFYPSQPREQIRRYLGIAAPTGSPFTSLEITDRVAEARRLAGMRIPFAPVTRYLAAEGIEAYHALADGFVEEFDRGRLWHDIVSIASDIDMVVEAISRRLFSRRLFEHADDLDFYVFDSMLEQVPDPENRVVLQGERDALGLQQVRLDWRMQSIDRRTVWETATLLGEWLAAAGLGRLRILLHQKRTWGDQLSFAHHHSGATRMGDDLKTSVVDRHQKVHGLANLYVAGSSVFPTCGHVPVTLTVIATSIRLADHLKTAVRS